MDRADFNTDAILLRKIEYGDHDLIITFLTRDHGKIAAIAKNAKKSVRRFSGALDLFSANHIQCAFPKKNRDGLIILTQTVLDNGFPNIRYDVLKTGYACYWMEILTLWLEEGKAQPDLFELLYTSLGMLDRSEIQTEVAGLLFQIRFMSLSGFSPNLECCDLCRTGLDSLRDRKIWFDFREGRIICPDCRRKTGNGHRAAPDSGMLVSKGTLKQLAWINTNDTARADRMKFSPEAIKEGESLLESFIPFHLGRTFRSLGFLQRMRRER
ncbi:MAG: DNA repair protein RecO [Desulfobacter sp.]|nr:MAG: DNA repair protein RecO [Desulfobacter sp.]